MNIRRSLMAMGLVAAVAALPLLGASGAILSPMAGSVAVNGLPVTAGSAVVAGDLVSTNAAGSARMVLPGGSLIAASNTNFRMVSVNNTTQVRLNSGLVKVTGMLPVELNTRTIVPATAQTRFNVYDLSGKVYVEAIAGTVTVKAAHSAYAVHTGNAVTFSDQAPAAAMSSGASLSLPVAIGIGAAAAIVTGIVVHQVTKCTNANGSACVSSPSQL